MKNKIANLRKTVETKNVTLENDTCTIKGVSNLSQADRDMILMYLDNIEQYGYIAGLMEPIGNIGQVFKNAKIIK